MQAVLVRRRRIGLAAAVIAALLSAGCAAGQQAQTADESPSLDGTNANVGDIALRGLAVEAPHGIAYQPGANASVKVVLVNTGRSADRLTSISSPAASGWAAYGGGKATAEVLKPASSVTIPAGSRVSYGVPESTGTLLLTGVKSKLYPGNTIDMTLTFADAGSVDLTVPIQLSTSPHTSVVPGPSATGQG